MVFIVNLTLLEKKCLIEKEDEKKTSKLKLALLHCLLSGIFVAINLFEMNR